MNLRRRKYTKKVISATTCTEPTLEPQYWADNKHEQKGAYGLYSYKYGFVCEIRSIKVSRERIDNSWLGKFVSAPSTINGSFIVDHIFPRLDDRYQIRVNQIGHNLILDDVWVTDMQTEVEHAYVSATYGSPVEEFPKMRAIPRVKYSFTARSQTLEKD
jgi:hypothetical protein